MESAVFPTIVGVEMRRYTRGAWWDAGKWRPKSSPRVKGSGDHRPGLGPDEAVEPEEKAPFFGFVQQEISVDDGLTASL